MRRILILSCLALTPLFALADAPTPVGVWKTVDDTSGKPTALVKIVEVNGELRGTITKLYREPNEVQEPRCDKCTGAKKDAPIIGMTILSGLHHDEDGGWSGGEILDPDSGDTYHSKLMVAPDNKSLQVRGYIGVPLLGRSQTWQRAE